MNTLPFWFLAFRPKTLTAAIVPVLVGSALVAAQDKLPLWWVTACALLSALAIQIATNLINDSIDFKKGADTEERLGPKRLVASGVLDARKVMQAGFWSLFVAVVFGVPLVYQGGWVMMVVGLVSLFLAYSYTGGFFPLAYLGLGDAFVVMFFGWIAVGGTYYLHTLGWSPAVWVAGAQIGALATVLIAINNLRDIAQDRKANKKTLAVRWGKTFVRSEICFLLGFSYVLQAYWWLANYRLAAALPLLFFPLAYQVGRGICSHDPGPIYNRYLAKAAMVHLGFGLTLTVGLWLA